MCKQQKEMMLTVFLDQTDTLVCFWNDTFEESKFISLNCNGNLIRKKFYYLKKCFKVFLGFKDVCNLQNQFLNQRAYQILNDIKNLYSMIFSDQQFIKKSADLQLYQIEILFQKFFEIYDIMRPTNRIKTLYLCKKLTQLTETTFKNFIFRYPAIRKQYMKIDPENGSQFFEL